MRTQRARRHYVQKGADIELKHLPHSNSKITNAPETITIKNATIPPDYRNELNVGAWRWATAGPEDIGLEHGDCTIHELVIYKGTLSDADMQRVYTALVARWK